MNLFYPLTNTSKACWVLDAFASSVNCQKQKHPFFNNKTGVFWGLAGHNFATIKEYQQRKIPWIFTDMPYWRRWMGDNRETCYWRIIPNALHCNWIKNYPSDRFDKLNLKIKDWSFTGDYILVCPSSSTLERFYDSQNWINRTVMELKKYTDRPIKIRNKPRKNGTSGPRVADVPFEEDCKNAWAVVTLASISGVEAACLGKPVFCHESSMCAPIGNLDLSLIETPVRPNRKYWLNTLAYYQYTEDEIRCGTYKTIV